MRRAGPTPLAQAVLACLEDPDGGASPALTLVVLKRAGRPLTLDEVHEHVRRAMRAGLQAGYARLALTAASGRVDDMLLALLATCESLTARAGGVPA